MENIHVLKRESGTKVVMNLSQMIYTICGGFLAIFLLGCGAVLFMNENTVNPKAFAAAEKAIDESEARSRRELESAEKRWLERHTEMLSSQEKIKKEFTDVVIGLRGEMRARDNRTDDKFDRIMERLPRKISGL